jgi:subtilisin-like proprotein convertase family protein
MTSVLRVADDVSIQGVEVTVNATHPDPSVLTVTLVAPPQGAEPGLRRVLWNGANPLRTGTVLALKDFNGLSGRGDWTLEVAWGASPIRGEFNGWQLNLLGLATYSVAGSMKTVQGTNQVELPGATLTLAGGNILYQAVSGTNGAFGFSGLTENLYTLGASRLGYQDGSTQFRITRSNVALPSIVLNPITTGTNQILATPEVGAAPLRVEFAPRIPLAQLTALGTNIVATWDFGDGTPLLRLTNSPAVIEHRYVTGIHTRARLVLSGSLGSITNLSPDIHAHSLAANPAIAPHQAGLTNLAPRTWYVHSLAPWGSLGASPVTNTVLTVVSNAPATGILYQESQRDTAAFDIDRIGAGLPAFRPSAEDTAFFLQPSTPYVRGTLRDPVDRALGEPATAYKTYTGNQRFRMVCTLGGSVFGTVPAAAGNLRIQTSRIEP